MGGPRADGAALAGIGTLLVGSSFAASSLLTQFPFFSGQALRFALGGVGLLVIALTARARWPRPTTWELAVLALLAATGLVGFNLACLASLRYSEPAALGVVVGCAPLVVVLARPADRLPPTVPVAAPGGPDRRAGRGRCAGLCPYDRRRLRVRRAGADR
jgi:drug/metabolite transporter (DMT)-like permease